MNTYNVVNLNEFTWHLNVAIGGLVFSIFSLIYNDFYIYYGLTTALFGILGHMFFKFFSWLFKEETDKKFWIYYVFNICLASIWLISLFYIY